ncbi:Type 2A phosphatase activator TIP41 [Kluyveromyces marxianus]
MSDNGQGQDQGQNENQNPDVKQSSAESRRPFGSGIPIIQVNQAREMFQSTVRARRPGSSQPRDTVTMRESSVISTRSLASPMATQRPNTMMSPRPKMKPKTTQNHPHKSNNPNNPNCDHCGVVIVPSPVASLPAKDDPSVTIGDWTITTTKRPILSSDEIDAWTEKLHFPIPEMIFGNSGVEIINNSTNWWIKFSPFHALSEVKLGDSGLRVSYSEKWLNSKLKSSQISNTEEGLQFGKHWDWSYTTLYKGTTNEDSDYEFVRDDDYQLPIDKLSRRDPILFYDDFILFEDELADNGISILSIKLRVMAERLLLLCRFFLRVDEVLFKIVDTRLYIEFAEELVVREWKYMEDDYKTVLNKCKMNSSDPKRSLRDSNWVGSVLPLKERVCEVLRKKETV